MDPMQLLLQHMPLLLRLFWVLAAGSVIVTLLPVPLPHAFKDAVRLSASRGKLWTQRPQSLGPLNELSVPQSWFLHFYMVGTLSCLACLSLATSLRSSTSSQSDTQWQNPTWYLGVGLFTLHLVRRLLETACLLVYPPHARMHVIAYAFGLAYYLVAPVSLLPDTVWGAEGQPGSLWQWVQGGHGWAHWRQGLQAAPSQLMAAVNDLLSSRALLHLLGTLVMVLGFLLQFHSHWVLSRLTTARPATQGVQRRASPRLAAAQASGSNSSSSSSPSKAQAAQKEGYVIPRGGAFELVSCPHYLGEIVIYLGLAMLCWPQDKPVMMLVWVVVNLVLAAGATQRWYQSQFPRYPRHRRALIPYVY